MKKILFTAALLTLAFTSCQKDAQTEKESKAISLSTSINQTVTRINADRTAFDATDELGLYITDGSGTIVGDNLLHHTGDVYYWDNFTSRTLKFSAYYPKVSALPAGSTPTSYKFVPTAGGDEFNDLLISTGEAITFPSAASSLTFNHAMHKIVVTLVSDKESDEPYYTDTNLNAAVVTVLAEPVAEVNLIDATVTKKEAATEYIAAALHTDVTTTVGATSTFYVSPQAIDNTKPFVRIVLPNPTAGAENQTVTYTYSLPSLTQLADGLKSGYQLEIVLKLKKSGITVSSSQINPWNAIVITDGTADSELDDNDPNV